MPLYFQRAPQQQPQFAPRSYYRDMDDLYSDPSEYERIANEHQRRADIARDLARKAAYTKQVEAEYARRQAAARREIEECERRQYINALHQREAAAQRRRSQVVSIEDVLRMFGAEDNKKAQEFEKKVHFDCHGERCSNKGKGKGQASEPVAEPKPTDEEDGFSKYLMGLMGTDASEQEQMLRQFGLFPRRRPQQQQRPTSTAGPSGLKKQAPVQVPISIPTPASPTPSNHSQSFSSIDQVESQFNNLKSNFTFPSSPSFTPEGKFEYSTINAPVNQYESDLVKLLTKLDAIDSDGAESVRGARKALVRSVEAELNNLDNLKAEAWKNIQTAASEKAIVVEEKANEDVVQGYTFEESTPIVIDAPVEEKSQEVVEVVEAITTSAETEEKFVGEPNAIVVDTAAEVPEAVSEVESTAVDSILSEPEAITVDESPSKVTITANEVPTVSEDNDDDLVDSVLIAREDVSKESTETVRVPNPSNRVDSEEDGIEVDDDSSSSEGSHEDFEMVM